MQLSEAIERGQRIVQKHGECVFSVPHCAEVIAALLPPSMLVAEAAETARKQGHVLAYNHALGKICPLLAFGASSGWTLVGGVTRK